MARSALNFKVLGLLIYFGLSIQGHTSPINDARKAYRAGDIQLALNEVSNLLKTEPNNVSALFLKAQLLSDDKQPAAAIKSYQKLIQLAPRHLEAYNNLATLFAQQGKLELASDTLEKAIKTDPIYNTIHTNLRAIYRDRSKKHYRLALKLKPQTSQTQLLAMNTPDGAGNLLKTKDTQGSQPIPVPASTTLIASASSEAVSQVAEKTLTEAARKTAPKTNVAPKIETVATAKSISKPKITKTEIAKTTLIPVTKTNAIPVTTAKANVAPGGVSGSSAKEIKRALLAWANAWSNRNPTQYVNAYESNYATLGKTNEDWVAGRRWNFKTKKFIKIEISDILIKRDGNRYRAIFQQAYESDTFQDTVGKELIFVRQGGRWKIALERTT